MDIVSADDETWEKRFQKRINVLVHVRNSPQYIDITVRLRFGDLQDEDIPHSPDPYRTCSKRQWEADMKRWRQALRKLTCSSAFAS